MGHAGSQWPPETSENLHSFRRRGGMLKDEQQFCRGQGRLWKSHWRSAVEMQSWDGHLARTDFQTSGISTWVELEKKKKKKNGAKVFSQCFATSASGLCQNPEVTRELKMKTVSLFCFVFFPPNDNWFFTHKTGYTEFRCVWDFRWISTMNPLICLFKMRKWFILDILYLSFERNKSPLFESNKNRKYCG